MKKRISASLFVVAVLMATHLAKADGNGIILNATGEPIKLKLTDEDGGVFTATRELAPNESAEVDIKGRTTFSHGFKSGIAWTCLNSMTINGQRITLIPHRPCDGNDFFTIIKHEKRARPYDIETRPVKREEFDNITYGRGFFAYTPGGKQRYDYY